MNPARTAVGLSRLRFAELTLAEESTARGCDPGTAVIFFFLQGEVIESSAKAQYRCAAGTLLYRPPEAPYVQVVSRGPATIFRIEIDRDPANRLPFRYGTLTNYVALPSTHFHGILTRMRQEVLRRDQLSPMVLKSLFLDLTATGARILAVKAAPPPAWLVEALTILRERLTEPLTLTQVAREVKVHRTTLAAACRQALHMSFGDYLRRERVELALERLQSASLSMSDIAAQCGFCDQSHFVRVFRASTGMTPTQYRRSLSGCFALDDASVTGETSAVQNAHCRF